MEAKKIILYTILALSLAMNICCGTYIHTSKTVRMNNENISRDTLSNWEVFTLALMKVESEYNNNAVSSAGARGYFQITPVYVREVNRIHKTNYTFDQVTDFNKAYEIFDLMQKAHNPEYNMDKALELHNGKHTWYNKRVYNEMKKIKKYEDMRDKLKNI